MKLARTRAIAILGLLGLGAGACGVEDPGDTPAGELGSIEVALSAAPADARCLRVTVTGTRTVSKSVELTPGAPTIFLLDKLPAGIAQVDGNAYDVACAAIAAATPAWVTEAPVIARVDAVVPARVLLKLIRNGKLEVAVDFELPGWVSDSKAPIDLAVFGDTPYGAAQIADYPNFIASVNADPLVKASLHVGDIKNGSSRCDTSYFQFVLDGLNALAKPVLFTPGDNEWTDCHRANNGAFDPLERLAVLRDLFYPLPGLSLGMSKKEVLSQSFFKGFETFVENQLWVEAGAVFSLVHAVGSNNNLLPWFGDDMTGTKMDDPARRTAEVAARNAANLDWLERTFATAKAYGAATVIVAMQADTWTGAAESGFTSTIQKLAALTVAFGKPVLLIQGDSHIYKTDKPLAAGDAGYGVAFPVPNLTRVVVQGSTTTPKTEWIRLHVDPAAVPPFAWTRIAR